MIGNRADAQPIRPPPPPYEQPPPVEKPIPPETVPAVAPSENGPLYPFDRLVVEYAPGYPSPVPIDRLLAATHVNLVRSQADYLVPVGGEPTSPIALGILAVPAAGETRRLSAAAINAICRSLVLDLNSEGVIGVQVAPDPAQIDLRTLADRRDPANDSTIRILILPAWVRTIDVMTVESADAEPVPSKRFRWIGDDSPVRPSTDGATAGDAVRRDELEDYVRRLSRHPGRQVDATISPAGTSGEVTLNYLVRESRPWSLLGQISNTGTSETGDLRQRFQFVHAQLTGRDDILTLDYITADFQDTNAFLGSYETPLFGHLSPRGRVFGSWQQYTASDLGFGDAAFNGESWSAGAEVIGTVFQHRALFLDLVGGVRFERQEVDNEVAGTSGESPFLFGYVGAELERVAQAASTRGSLRLEWTMSNLVDVNEDELDTLGRIDADSEWVVLKFDFWQSFYLEPLIFGERWADPDQPVPHSLAHEIAVSLRGQYAFDYRLTAPSQSVIGGLYTVRGYPEALTAGDTTIAASAEYRFHLPRALAVRPEPCRTPILGRPFRVAPDRPSGYPDWDLVLKAFVDVGRSVNNDRQSFEHDDTLVGAGVGVDFVLRQNLSVRVDWGVALNDVPGEVSAGSNRLHFVVTVQY